MKPMYIIAVRIVGKTFTPSDIRYIGFTVGTYSMPLYEPNFD